MLIQVIGLECNTGIKKSPPPETGTGQMAYFEDFKTSVHIYVVNVFLQST